MGLLNFARLASFFARVSRFSHERPSSFESIEELPDRVTGAEPARCDYDLYLPKGKHRAAMIALHGVTLNGRKDARLMHFGRCLAKSGVACAVPTVAGLSVARPRGSDLDALADLVTTIAEDFGDPGLIGFSYGGSYALVTACRADVAHRVRFVLAIGAYYSLDNLFGAYIADRDTLPSAGIARDDALYLRAALAYGHRDLSSFPDARVHELEALLRSWCHHATADEKESFCLEHLADPELISRETLKADPRALNQVSPVGKLDGLGCRVGLIHDRNDTIVPPSESKKIYQELLRAGGERQHTLLITPLLSHVNLATALNLAHVKQLYGAMAPILDSADR